MTYMIHICLVLLFIHLVIFLSLCLFQFTFIPSHRKRPEDAFNTL